MDELAEKLNLDPIELRMRNEPTEDPEKHIPYSSRHLIACLQEGARRFGWNKRNPEAGSDSRRTLAGGNGRGCGDARESATAFQGQCPIEVRTVLPPCEWR